MKAIGRSVLAVLAGTIVAMILISGVEMISSTLYPPPGLGMHDAEGMARHIDSLPIGAFLLVLGDWALGACCGAWLAARLAERARLVHGLVVGALFLLAAISTMLMLPHPAWMWIGAIIALTGCSYLGARLATTTSPPVRAVA
jgi:hypothetical protein